MGLYNDYRHERRTEWEFEYTGEVLLPYAEARRDSFSAKERAARDALVVMLNSTAPLRGGDDVLRKNREAVEHAGAESEKCSAWVSEFRRNPEKVYNLAVGDLTYFGIGVAADPAEGEMQVAGIGT